MNNPIANILSGLLGGLIVLVLGAILISTDVIDTGDSNTVVQRQAPMTQQASDSNGGRTVRDIYASEGRGVAFISADGVTSEESSPFGSPQEGSATGSGFVVSKDGTILTNAHVVDGADSVTVSFKDGGEEIPAEVKGVDTSTDLAVLKIDPSDVDDLQALPLGDSSKAEVGDPVVAIGNPFGYSRTVTTGIVSGLQREIIAPDGFQINNVIQTDASINPGNSGGPLLDANGRVIGINSQIATGGGQGSVGIGFAVPVDTAKKLLPQLRQGGEIEHAWLGVQMSDVDADGRQAARPAGRPRRARGGGHRGRAGGRRRHRGRRLDERRGRRRDHRDRRPDDQHERRPGFGDRRQAARRQGRDRVLPRR